MATRKFFEVWLPALLVCLVSAAAIAQSFRVQCPIGTSLHPAGGTKAKPVPNAAIKCQEISGGDGFATMGDGRQIYLFGFGPLSGLENIANGLPGTVSAADFNEPFDPNSFLLDNSGNPTAGANPNYSPNGALMDPKGMMDVGVLNANFPAPLMAIDEDDEFFLTLTNVGMIMRPDLFEQHTVHFHGYPNASSFFDGVPDASVAVNIGGSMTYYYTAPDAGTYFWHCHITPPEHLQMGMVGQLYVRPRQNRVGANQSLYVALQAQNLKWGSANCADILCTGSTPLPTSTTSATQPPTGAKYAYNDGDGSTRYDVEYAIQMMGFDPNFHFGGMTFNPESFADMKDKYFMLSGRSYPDTVNTTGNYPDAVAHGAVGLPVASPALYTEASDGMSRPSQPLPSRIVINKSGGQTRALLRISDLSVTEFTTLATVGIPMEVIAVNARLLRDMAGNNLYYNTNSITMGGGESTDVILDARAIDVSGGPRTFFLYSTNLDHLSNDAENFGGLMTEIVVQ